MIDDPGTIIILALILGAILAAISAGRHSQKCSDRPEVILRRCKIQLAATYAELMSLPATREVYELRADIQRVDHLIDEKLGGPL